MVKYKLFTVVLWVLSYGGKFWIDGFVSAHVLLNCSVMWLISV